MTLHQTNCNFAMITSVMTKQWNLVGWVARRTYVYIYTGELGYDGLSGTRKIGPSYAKSVICI